MPTIARFARRSSVSKIEKPATLTGERAAMHHVDFTDSDQYREVLEPMAIADHIWLLNEYPGD